MGLGQKFWHRLGQFFVPRVGLGQAIYGFEKFPLKIFSFCIKKNLCRSGQRQVGLLFTAGQK